MVVDSPYVYYNFYVSHSFAEALHGQNRQWRTKYPAILFFCTIQQLKESLKAKHNCSWWSVIGLITFFYTHFFNEIQKRYRNTKGRSMERSKQKNEQLGCSAVLLANSLRNTRQCVFANANSYSFSIRLLTYYEADRSSRCKIVCHCNFMALLPELHLCLNTTTYSDSYFCCNYRFLIKWGKCLAFKIK